MESVIASGSDFLVGPLSYEVLQDQASYVTARRFTQTFANTPEVGPNSVKSLKFNIADPNGFLDLSSLCFSFKVNNNAAVVDAAAGTPLLTPLTAIPHNYFSRMIVRCSSALCEDVQHLGRTEEMFSRFMSLAKRQNAAIQGHGQTGGTTAGDDLTARPIKAGDSKTVVWRPLTSGLLNCNKWLPGLLLGAGGLTIEFELAPAADAVNTHADFSQSYTLSDCVCHVDSCQLTSELTEQYSSMLLSGRSIMIPYQTLDCTLQHLTAKTGAHSLNMAKQFTRLDTVFLSLAKEEPAITANPAGTKSRLINQFYLPAASKDTIESFIQINNKRWGDFNTKGAPQHWNRLTRAIGTANSIAHSSNMNDVTYGCSGTQDANSFVAGFDLEKVSQASGSGESVTTGGLVSVHITNAGSGDVASPTRAFLVASYSALVELKDTGCFVYS